MNSFICLALALFVGLIFLWGIRKGLRLGFRAGEQVVFEYLVKDPNYSIKALEEYKKTGKFLFQIENEEHHIIRRDSNGS